MVDYALGTVKSQDPQGTLASFPNVVTKTRVKRNGKETGEPKYSINFEFEPGSDDLKRCKAAAVAVAREAKPGVDLATLKFPFENGDKLADKAKTENEKSGHPNYGKNKLREWSRGKAVLTARTTTELEIGLIANGSYRTFEGENRVLAKPYFYTGVQVVFEVLFKYYDAVDENGKPGVTCYLQKVTSLNKGKKLTAATSGAETFSHYVGIVSSENPAEGLEDEIPF